MTHKTICLSHTQRTTQHKLFEAGTIFLCSIAQLILLTQNHNDQHTVLITMNGFQEARSMKS